jgi:hypothetical protein
MLKKMMMLAGMALMVAAFVGTASASANTRWVHWTVNAEEAEEKTTVEEITEDFTGFAKFEVVGATGNNFGCNVHAHVHGYTKTNPTTGTKEAHAEVTSFEITTSTCKGEGVFATCELESHSNTAEEKPWTVDVSTTDFVVTNVAIKNTYKNCLVAPANLSFPEVTATPNNPEKINCLTLTGRGLNISTVVEATGTLCGYHEGTYGIE